MGSINKAVWLSYDLGIGGDYPGLYKWLDNHKAIECGNSVAFFQFPIDEANLKRLPEIILEDIDSDVDLRAGDRLYIVFRDVLDGCSNVRGKYIYGKRRSNPWEGYGDSKQIIIDDGE